MKRAFKNILIALKDHLITYLILVSMSSVCVFVLCILVIMYVWLRILIANLPRLMNYESRKLVFDQSRKWILNPSEKWFSLLISIVFRFVFQIQAGLERGIGYRSRTFLQSVLYSKSFAIFHFLVLGVTVLVGSIASILLLRRIGFVFRKLENDPNGDAMSTGENLIVVCTVWLGVLPFASVLKTTVSYSLSFWSKIFAQLARNRVGAGLICGFISTATMGPANYVLLAPLLSLENFEDSFFFEHQQERVAAITGFFLGQCLKFLFFYNFSIYEKLYQWNLVVLVFLSFLVFQVFWTHETIIKNWKFIRPNDKRKRVLKRIFFVQVQLIGNFFLQLSPTDSRIEKLNSTVRVISVHYIPDPVFVRMTFLGWLLGHVVFVWVYTKVFGLLRVWVYPSIKDIFGGGNEDSWD